jgi:SAM-dependent methyltransferase
MQPAEYTRMDEAEGSMWWYRALHVRLLDALADVTAVPANGADGADHLPGSRTQAHVLDAGCGTGRFLQLLHIHQPDLERVGVEWSAAAAKRAKEKSGAHVLCGSVNALPLADASFDAAVCADVLCHDAVDPDAALKELRRVLRPGGRLVVNMPAYQWLLATHDRRVHNVRRQTASATTAMLRRAGFIHIRARYWNALLLPLMVVQRKLVARGDSASDVARFPPWLDASLHGMTEFERRLPFALPAGGSVLAVSEKP